MATSLIGPLFVASALAAAPVPRPPQPTRAIWIVWFSPACTAGMAPRQGRRRNGPSRAPQKFTPRRTWPLGDVHEFLLRRMRASAKRAETRKRNAGFASRAPARSPHLHRGLTADQQPRRTRAHSPKCSQLALSLFSVPREVWLRQARWSNPESGLIDGELRAGKLQPASMYGQEFKINRPRSKPVHARKK